MLEELLAKEEGKTLEFKENTQSLQKIVQTIIAFANTAGGTLVVGIRDKTKEVIGLTNILQDEEKIAGAVADCVMPLIFPTFNLFTWRNKDVLIINVSHNYGPFYLKSKGIEEGTFVRLGSTNRLADKGTIQEIQRLKHNKHFDELANFHCPLERVQFNVAEDLFATVSKKLTKTACFSLGLIIQEQERILPSNAAVLLFANLPKDYFPDAIIRMGRFLGSSKSSILDQQTLEVPLSMALGPILMFIQRHTSIAGKIGATRREDIPQYPAVVVREAVINALLHTDYSIKGSSITIAIFDDRIEITNPGALPLGFNLEAALSGISLLRNRIIGRVFRELSLIEQWGSGLKRMIDVSLEKGIKQPKFEEVGNYFRVTLYHAPQKLILKKEWQVKIVEYLHEIKKITPKQAQKLWKVTTRTTTSRLKQMCQEGILIELATSPFDPYKSFSLAKENV